MTLRLNENRPFGTIHPPMNGAYYEQDGELFDHEKVAMRKTAGAAKGAAKSAPSSSEANRNTSQASDLDLDAWVRGEVKAGWFAVKKAALAKFPDIDTTNAATVKARLVAEGVGGGEDN